MNLINKPKSHIKLGALSFSKVVLALLEGPCSVPELMTVSGLSNATLQQLMRAMRKDGIAHIADWEKDSHGRHSLRVYAIGPGHDAQPKRKSHEEVLAQRRKHYQRTRHVALAVSSTESASLRQVCDDLLQPPMSGLVVHTKAATRMKGRTRPIGK